jgi:hypothetical protein
MQGRPKEVAVWWPPVGQALRAVGLLYGALDSSTFGGVAQDCIAAATASVQSASRAVAKSEASFVAPSALHQRLSTDWPSCLKNA